MSHFHITKSKNAPTPTYEQLRGVITDPTVSSVDNFRTVSQYAAQFAYSNTIKFGKDHLHYSPTYSDVFVSSVHVPLEDKALTAGQEFISTVLEQEARERWALRSFHLGILGVELELDPVTEKPIIPATSTYGALHLWESGTASVNAALAAGEGLFFPIRNIAQILHDAIKVGTHLSVAQEQRFIEELPVGPAAQPLRLDHEFYEFSQHVSAAA